MNRFEESEEVNKINEKLKRMAFEANCDYKPMNDNLTPSQYAEHGYLKGCQELLETLLEKRVINILDIKEVLKNI